MKAWPNSLPFFIGILSIWSIVAHAAADSLLFLGNNNLPPYIWQQNGNTIGIVTDLMRAVAEKESLTINIKTMEWSQAQSLVAVGKADALLQINPTPEQKRLFDFSVPLLESHFHIFRRANLTKIQGLQSLAGKWVGVEQGGFPQQFLEQHTEIKASIITDKKTGFEMLQDGSLDAIFIDRWVGEYMLQVHKIRDIIAVEPAVISNSSRIAVKKGNHELLALINAGLAAIQSDATRSSIENSWLDKQLIFVSREKLNTRVIDANTALL